MGPDLAKSIPDPDPFVKKNPNSQYMKVPIPTYLMIRPSSLSLDPFWESKEFKLALTLEFQFIQSVKMSFKIYWSCVQLHTRDLFGGEGN